MTPEKYVHKFGAEKKFDPYLKFAEKSDIDLRAVSSAVNTAVKGGFTIRLVTDAQMRVRGLL